MKKKLSAIFWTIIGGIAALSTYENIILFLLFLAMSIGYFCYFVYLIFQKPLYKWTDKRIKFEDSRAIKRTSELLFTSNNKQSSVINKKFYSLSILVLIIGTFLLIWAFEGAEDFGVLVNIDTIISFIVAPVIAVFNQILVLKHIPKEAIPPKWLINLARVGILYLVAFTLFYLFYIL